MYRNVRGKIVTSINKQQIDNIQCLQETASGYKSMWECKEKTLE